MQLISAEQLILKIFEEKSRPSAAKLNRWMRTGARPARKVGGTWYNNEHVWLADGDEVVLSILGSDDLARRRQKGGK
jgi:hypothetical protein